MTARQVIMKWLGTQEVGTEFSTKSLHFDLFHDIISRSSVTTALKRLKDDGYVELSQIMMGRSQTWIVLKGKENELSD